MSRVLVIDDHDPSRNNLVSILRNSGYEVVGEGTTGAIGLALAATTAPDITLMAVGLPDIDGIRAARKIMQAHSHAIVLLTSHNDKATIDRAARAGLMGYLVKPLREGELRPAIELAIARFQEFVTLQKENENLKKTLGARKIIERAKGILMESQRLTEADAFALIQRKSMDTRKPMAEIAQAIVLAREVARRS
ncbi:MAG: ANTAR domain-containing response regulator [Alphaproteobacteria bacterium]